MYTGETASTFRLRSLILPVYLPTFLFAVGQGAVIPVIPLFARDLGASVAIAGFVVALRGMGTMVFDVPAGFMVTRLGERRSMLIGTVGLAVVAVGAGLSPSVPVFAALVFVMGCCWAIWLLARLAYVSDAAPVDRRGRALSLLGGTNRIGNFVGPILGGFAAAAFGLEAAFYLQAGVVLLAAAALYVLVNESGSAAEIHDGSVYQRFAGVVRDHKQIFFTAGLATIAIQVLRTSRQAVIPLWGDQIGLDAAEIGLVFGLSSAMDMTLFYPVGIIMDRWGRKWVAVPCLVIMAVGMTLVPTTRGFVPLLIVGLITGFGNGLGSGINMTLGADFAPARGRGEFLGVWRLIGDIGTAGGPIVVGAVAGIATLGAASVATGGIGFAGAAIMWLLVPEPLRRSRVTSPPPPASPGSLRG